MDERKAEGRYVSVNPQFLFLFKKLTTHPEQDANRKSIEQWLRPIKDNHEYLAISLYDARGKLVCAISDVNHPISGYLPDSLIRTYIQKNIHFTEITKEISANTYFLDLVVPIFDQHKIMGIVLFSIDPERYLFPMVHKEPDDSQDCFLN
jgi:C4-dicarboxylate-specific signal transduction histidine kinase